ncbi:MAG: hypothetical protein K0R00_492 [Herbinix sp.]|jgi:hypothetical protein|nr:hypothetical protein [Herbinix sp.]
MKELKDELIILSTAQERMKNVTELMCQWNNSQINTEKCAFEAMNTIDYVQTRSKESKSLLIMLQECYKEIASAAPEDKRESMASLLDELNGLLHLISETTATANDIAHRMEDEIAFQKVLGDDIHKELVKAGESIDLATAATELIMVDL